MRNYFSDLARWLCLGAWMTIISGCGGNSTPVGITVTPVDPTILLGKPRAILGHRYWRGDHHGNLADLSAAFADQLSADGVQPGRNRTDPAACRIRHHHHRRK